MQTLRPKSLLLVGILTVCLAGTRAVADLKPIGGEGFDPPSELTPMDAFDVVGGHIRSANVTAICSMLAPQTDIAIMDKEALYNKGQAEMVLKAFFAKYPCKSFTIKHRGASPDGTQYAIGQYMPAAAPAMRTYIVLRGKPGAQVIEELRFEAQ